MKAAKIILILGFFSVNIFAQERTDSAFESITIPELRDHLFYLASDELQGRMIGTTGFDKAAEYSATQFRQAGIMPLYKSDSTSSYFQTFKLAEYAPNLNNNIIIKQDKDERKFTFEDNFILGYNMGPVKEKVISGKLVFAGAGIIEPKYGINDYKNIDANGKWVVIIAPPDDLPLALKKKLPADLFKKYELLPFKRKTVMQNAINAGALGIICITSKEFFTSLKNRTEFFRNIMDLTDEEKHGNDSSLYPICYASTLPLIFMDSLMTDFLFKKEKFDPYIFNKESYRTFELENSELTFNKEYKLESTVNTENIIGLIEGSDPALQNEYIVLSAHLDHLGFHSGKVMNGSDDNASGCAGVMEIGEALVKAKPKRSVICVLFFGEESFFLGSGHFVFNPPVPLEKIVANVNIDMIGFSDDYSKGIKAGYNENLSAKLRKILQETGNKYKNMPLNWNYNENSTSSSDHYSFLNKNIPAVWFYDGQFQTYHTPTDDPEIINYKFLNDNCKFIFNVGLDMANADSLK